MTAAPVGGVLKATINGKTISYTVATGDTITTATAAWLALLGATDSAPPEFNELSWTSPATDTVAAAAQVPGQPFSGMTGGLEFTATTGATLTQTQTTASSGPNDISLAANWRRNGVAALPQSGDDMVIADSNIPLLWNLDALQYIQLNSYTRYQSFTGTIGLPENNPNGYFEYRPTYLKLSGPPWTGGSSSSPGPGQVGVFVMILGFGQNGSGPQRERYDVGTQDTSLTLLAAGQPLDAYAVRFLGTNTANVLTVTGSSLGVAMLPGETATVASATVTGGALLALGPTVTFIGALTVTGAQVDLNCAPSNVTASNGSTLAQGTIAAAPALTYPQLTLRSGSQAVWLSPSSVQTLTIQTSSVFSKASDQRAMTVTDLTIDADSCQLLDPYNAITFTNPIVLNNAVSSGPLVFGAGRTVRVI